MTNIKPLPKFIEEISEGYVESKENPEEWYVLIGKMCGEYSVNAADRPDDYEEFQRQLPYEEQDGTENVDGFFQIGAQGWSGKAFEETSDLVSDFIAHRGDGRVGKLDTALMNIIVVHEDYLSEAALELSDGETKQPQAAADGGEQA